MNSTAEPHPARNAPGSPSAADPSNPPPASTPPANSPLPGALRLPAGGTGGDKLRVLLITEADPLYVIRFFEVFFSEYPRDRFDIVGITVDAAFHESKVKTAQRIHRFYGTIDFARLLFRFGCAKLRRVSIESLAGRHGIRHIPCSSVNSPEYLASAGALKPDVIVSVAAPEIFKTGILSTPRFGCINIHSGRLPVYRGMMPNFWQLLHGERFATLTVHEMAPKLDAGGIIAVHEFPLLPNDSLDRVITRTKQEGARLMIRVLDSVRDGSARATPLDMTGAKYFSFPKPEDVRAFRARGHRMI